MLQTVEFRILLTTTPGSKRFGNQDKFEEMNMKTFKLTILFILVTIYSLNLVPVSHADSLVARRRIDFKTTITVNSGADPDISSTKTCISDSPCTLRRAIVQANALPLDARPILIEFDMPANTGSGYVSSLKVWRIRPQAGAGSAVFPSLELGGITIDARTQPGGRNDGPIVILLGPGNGSNDGMIIGADNSGLHDSNELIGFAFQNFRDHVVVNSSLNLLQENWFGLNDRGELPYLIEGNAQNGTGRRGILLREDVITNDIEANIFLGLIDAAAVLDGEDNFFIENFIGTDKNGAVPGKQTDPAKICSGADWLGGSGIVVNGAEQLVANNILVGLRLEVIAPMQPEAIRVYGEGHMIEDNAVGIDFNGSEVGVCGHAIVLNGPQTVNVTGNNIVNPRLSGLILDGFLYNANTLSGNLIRRDQPWPEAENAVKFGPQLPQSLRNFMPARVTGAFCTTISGTHGFESPCPNCDVEIFLDDRDNVVETLQSLAIVTADASGNWQATLPRPLTGREGLRLMSTIKTDQTISGLSSGTTSGLSALYPAPACNFMPAVRADK
jgi:hypothetical protein